MSIITAERRYRKRGCAALTALALVFVCLFSGGVPAYAASDGMVRVRLTRLGAPDAVTLTADCDYVLASDATVRIPAGEKMVVAAVGDTLTLSAGQRRMALGHTARFMRAGAGAVNGAQFMQPELSGRFCGDLGFAASGGVVSAILNIYVETYLYGVVGCEMPPSSGMEALKAQAVAARTYALRKKADRSGSAYDLTDAGADQVFRGYNGASEYESVVRAVEGTRGVVLYSGGAPAQCAYCDSNGGQTESAGNAWGTDLSYYVVRDDPYDLQGGGTEKSATVNKDLSGIDASLKKALISGMTAQLEARGLSAETSGIQVNGIESITACDPRFSAPSRLYRSLVFKLSVTGQSFDGERQTGSMSVSIPTYGGFEDWYGLGINTEDNETVWVTESDRAFMISFRRQGDGVGMSQCGARVMAEQGLSARDILTFYYPGAEIRALTLPEGAQQAADEAPRSERAPIATARLSDRTDLMSAPKSGAKAEASIAAGAVVDIYGVQGDWAAAGIGDKYGYIPAERLESYTPVGSKVTRPDDAVYAEAVRDQSVLQLPESRANAIAEMPVGSRVQVFAWTDDWAMVQAPNGFMGFVPLASLKLAGGDDAAGASGAENATKTAPNGVTIAGDTLYGQLRQDCALYASDNVIADQTALLYQGSLVKILAYNEAWALVRTQTGEKGYLPLSSLRALDSSQKEVAAPSVAEGGAIRKVSGVKYLYVKDGGAAVYTTWSTGATIVSSLTAGDRVRLGAYNERWACVKTDAGVTGYMLRTSLTDKAPGDEDIGPVTRAEAGTTAVSVRKDAPVYRGYSEDSDVIAALDLGERVEVGAYSAVWAMVKVGELTGYVRTADLKLEREDMPDASQAADARATVRLNLYAEARTESRVLARIPKGARVSVFSWGNGFAQVQYKGRTGYVRLKYLERLP
ncbi:MAG: SpoIID/LytB domain-containing protein [Clostridia bacterium]|nr:SpoIID/LytB domain-containing protein [Clostridia bacterium]